MKELFAAMAKAFPEIEGASKDKNNPAFKSKYADLGSVVDAIKPALIAQGLFFVQKTHEQPDGVCVETFVCHQSGQEMSFGNLFVPATKKDAQGYGSALTYARRYSLMTAFGVCPEDDDGNAASQHRPAPVHEVKSQNNAALSDAQFAQITTMMETAGADAKGICEFYNVKAINAMTAEMFEHAMTQLRDTIEARSRKAA